jgi:DNA repair protein RecO (recombination protein O)
MIQKTRGIVLHQAKYTDSGIIVHVYTHNHGRMSFIVKGARNKKAGRHTIFFQPMFILDLVIYYKESRSMQTIREFSVSYTPSDIHSNIKKSSVAIFLGEVLYSVLREESANEELFEFIEDSVVFFDNARQDYANFHLGFMAGLSSYLGFEPGSGSGRNDIYFDMLNGNFVSVPPVHGHYANPEISSILSDLFSASYNNLKDIILTGSLRNEVLEVLVSYYSLHLPGLKKVKSLKVLKEVFS